VAFGAAVYLAALWLFAPSAASFVMSALGVLIRGDIRGLRALLVDR
jgi:hypothetical protein